MPGCSMSRLRVLPVLISKITIGQYNGVNEKIFCDCKKKNRNEKCTGKNVIFTRRVNYFASEEIAKRDETKWI